VAASSSVSAQESTPSPPAEVDLICHTDDPKDCYPKVFQPTDEFQVVRDDQELPSGLHVRLNVWTGEKEAKINVPDEQNPALEGLPVDSAVVVIDPEPAEEVKIPAGAPAYDAVGKIKTPSRESESFHKSLKIIKKGLKIDEALENLEDISHDIYYGLKIAEDYDTVKSLFCLANTDKIFYEGADESTLSRARLAALVLAGSVQNNAKALSELEQHWDKLKTIKCTSAAEPLLTATFRLTAPKNLAKPTVDNAAVSKARAAAIQGLIRSPIIRKDFLDNQGMERLLEVLVSKSQPDWEPVRRKVATLIQDNFLDITMGAALGEWPRDDQIDEATCKANTEISEKCWDWEAKKLYQQHKSSKGHWSFELWSLLKSARKTVKPKPRDRVEL
jgi:nucleotide exchange factor SIL1